MLRMMRFEFGEDFIFQILGHCSFIRTIGPGWDAFDMVAMLLRQPYSSIECPCDMPPGRATVSGTDPVGARDDIF